MPRLVISPCTYPQFAYVHTTPTPPPPTFSCPSPRAQESGLEESASEFDSVDGQDDTDSDDECTLDPNVDPPSPDLLWRSPSRGSRSRRCASSTTAPDPSRTALARSPRTAPRVTPSLHLGPTASSGALSARSAPGWVHRPLAVGAGLLTTVLVKLLLVRRQPRAPVLRLLTTVLVKLLLVRRQPRPSLLPTRLTPRLRRLLAPRRWTGWDTMGNAALLAVCPTLAPRLPLAGCCPNLRLPEGAASTRTPARERHQPRRECLLAHLRPRLPSPGSGESLHSRRQEAPEGKHQWPSLRA